jgi:hypothetical protein
MIDFFTPPLKREALDRGREINSGLVLYQKRPPHAPG